MIGFSYVSFGSPNSIAALFGSCFERARGNSFDFTSFGGLSIDGLVGLLPIIRHRFVRCDFVVLEICTSNFSLNGGSIASAREFLIDIIQFIRRVSRAEVIFLKLYRPDLLDGDTVLEAVESLGREYSVPLCEVTPSNCPQFEFRTVDGVHPDEETREFIASQVLQFVNNLKRPAATQPWNEIPPRYEFLRLDCLSQDNAFPFNGKGFYLVARMLKPGEHITLISENGFTLYGIYFLYGPETGYIHVEPRNGICYDIRSFDKRSYYRRLGFARLDCPSTACVISCSSITSKIIPFKETHLELMSRREFICGVLIKRL